MPAVLLPIIITLSLLAGCGAKHPGKTALKHAPSHAIQTPKSDAEIQRLMHSVRNGADINQVLNGLKRLQSQGPRAVREEATFRIAQLMLEGHIQGAATAANAAIASYPGHALTPYAHFWLARWWVEQDIPERALQEMRLALLHPRLTGELIDQILDIGPALAQRANEREAVNWWLAAAEIDLAGRDNWLRLAARRASIQSIEQMMREDKVSHKILADFALYAGRSRLMNGDVEAVRQLADWLAAAMPGSPEIKQLQAWASGKISATTIAVLLPLSGKYSRYGQQALRGIRIALASLEFSEYITLRVEDTASDPATAVRAYQQLSKEHINMIIGPLLADNTAAILPYMDRSIPVMSLTGRTDLAARSPALFIHTLSPLAQVQVMADYAWQHGARRMVVISDARDKQTEAHMFSAAFEALGGEITQQLQLDTANGQLDFREQLRQLRYDTDDERTLAELDQDASLFLPEMDVELRMPVSFDAAYLAMNGKQVALLAGQMAYAEISGIPLYGSSRWQDGHLLDDRGRYLARARFASSNITQDGSTEDMDVRRFRFLNREAWGNEKTSELMRLAYDSMRIATVISSRLGLQNRAILRELQDPEGFPAMTGHVQFDSDGVGQKKLDIFSIKNNEIIPAG